MHNMHHAHTHLSTVAVWDDLGERKQAAAAARNFELAEVQSQRRAGGGGDRG